LTQTDVGEDLLALRRGEPVRWDMSTMSLRFVRRKSPCPPPPIPSLLLLPPQAALDAEKAAAEEAAAATGV
jgi:hypothetical protein